MYIPVDLKVIEARAGRVAKGSGVRRDRVLAGLIDTWHRCWAEKSQRLTRAQLAGIFGSKRLDELLEALVAEEFLDPPACTCSRCRSAPHEGYRVGGAHKFVRLREAFAEGGKKTQKQLHDPALGLSPKAQPLRQSPDPEIPRSRDPEIPRSQDPDHRDPESPPRKRGLSEQEQCAANMETDRLMRCEELGLDPGTPRRPKPAEINAKLNSAIEHLGYVDQEMPDGVFTRWAQLEQLHRRYLVDEEFGRYDKEGKARDQPWPLNLFLSAGVLGRFKREAETPEVH